MHRRAAWSRQPPAHAAPLSLLHEPAYRLLPVDQLEAQHTSESPSRATVRHQANAVQSAGSSRQAAVGRQNTTTWRQRCRLCRGQPASVKFRPPDRARDTKFVCAFCRYPSSTQSNSPASMASNTADPVGASTLGRFFPRVAAAAVALLVCAAARATAQSTPERQRPALGSTITVSALGGLPA